MPHQSFILWFNGLSSAGKSTLAQWVLRELEKINMPVEILDGDVLRKTLHADLDFTEAGRTENVKRAAIMAKELCINNKIVLCSFITPLNTMRKLVRGIIEPLLYYELFVDTPIETCAKRDTKNLYKQARENKIQYFSGVNAPFELPDNADLIIPAGKMTVPESVAMVMMFLKVKGLV